MALSNELIDAFAKITNDAQSNASSSDSTMYGTVVLSDGNKYVKLDGSEVLTPVSTTTDYDKDDRVSVMIKNHTAIITGNISSPSAKKSSVDAIETKVTTLETVVADKVSAKDLEAVTADITALKADNVTITKDLDASKASISELTTNNATINGKITADEADINNLKTTKLDVTVADAQYATITNLDATNATVHNLDSTFATFQETTTNKLNANAASITNLESTKISTVDADIKYATITNLEATDASVTSLEAKQAKFETETVSKLTADEANISSLQTDKLNVTDAQVSYAKIDFTNIGTAALEQFYAKSGVIENVVVQNEHITGTLAGVTIKGDLIEGGTVVADKLVILGNDGLYYKLNTNGVTTSAEQTAYNSLNGSILTVNSVTADRISVNDLVAFGATIGGYTISSGSIHSLDKGSASSAASGVYMGSDGQFGVGNSTSYIKFYKDSNNAFKLEICADDIKLGTGKSLEELTNEANAAVSKIDNITVGGRNMLINSKSMDYSKYYIKENITYTSGDNVTTTGGQEVVTPIYIKEAS